MSRSFQSALWVAPFLGTIFSGIAIWKVFLLILNQEVTDLLLPLSNGYHLVRNIITAPFSWIHFAQTDTDKNLLVICFVYLGSAIRLSLSRGGPIHLAGTSVSIMPLIGIASLLDLRFIREFLLGACEYKDSSASDLIRRTVKFISNTSNCFDVNPFIFCGFVYGTFICLVLPIIYLIGRLFGDDSAYDDISLLFVVAASFGIGTLLILINSSL